MDNKLSTFLLLFELHKVNEHLRICFLANTYYSYPKNNTIRKCIYRKVPTEQNLIL